MNAGFFALAFVAAIATEQASGTFDVRLQPEGAEEQSEGTTLGRMTIEKQYHGDLEGAARGRMLTAVTSVDGSAGYVAIERVEGTLRGRRGTFVLQHTGTMSRGAQRLSITVVPDSGTGELAGLAGEMKLVIEGGEHSYQLEFTLPEDP
jgi:hypothetical protein